MPSPSAAPRPVQRRSNGIRTRAEIVAAAERLFAERGFEATRLDDIAVEVGIRRAAIFYHFGDKQEVYAAVLNEILAGFMTVLPSGGTATERLESALTGWIDYVAQRPSVARIILREAANQQAGIVSPFASAARTAIEWFRTTIDEGIAAGELAPRIEPYRFLSLMGAVTVFQFAALPWLSLNLPGARWNRKELDKHKREILLVARGMLGISAPP